MEKTIQKICKSLEKEKKIKILFAVENGSRAWRMGSKDSDYDVRLVFVRHIKDYIQINKPGEVIEGFYDGNGNTASPQNSVIDLGGFDVFKFVKMLSVSNPTTIEWLTTDIVYYGKQNKIFRHFAINSFNRISLYHHYKSMCRTNYLKYLKSGSQVTYKKYLYAYRGLVNAKWVANKKILPPIKFGDAIKKMNCTMPHSILNKLNEIIRLKSQGKEKDIVQNIVVMDSYIEQFLKDDAEAPKEKPHSTLIDLNNELQKIVLGQ